MRRPEATASRACRLLFLLRLAWASLVEDAPQPELPRQGLGSTRLQRPASPGDWTLAVSSTHELKVGHSIRLDAELSCEPMCSQHQPWSQRCELCSCAACTPCAESSSYHKSPADCRGPGAVEYAEVRDFGDGGVELQLSAALRNAHSAGEPSLLGRQTAAQTKPGRT